MPDDSTLIKKALALAQEAVTTAGKYLTDHKYKFDVLAFKDLQDIVTSVDIAVETKIIKLIESAFPKHNILSEENGQKNKGSDYTWVIDPLDGTKEYVRDIPLYCSAVMLQNKGVPIASAIFDPEQNELYSASQNEGATLNHQPIQVSSVKKLDKSMLFTYLPRTSTDLITLSPLFDQVYRVRGHANHNMSYCWVAKGSYEGHFSLFDKTKWWDIAPGMLILQEAGGRITDLKGKTLNQTNFSRQAIGTNGYIHQELLSASQKLFS